MKTQTILRSFSLFFGLAVFMVMGGCQYDRTSPYESLNVAKQAVVAECTGDTTNACAQLGTTEEQCGSLTGIACTWSEGACIPTTPCSWLDEDRCNLAASATNPIESCHWQINSCHGSIAEACRVYGTSQEACLALPAEGLHCQWLDGQCIVETDCEALSNEDDCKQSASLAAYCTWGAACYGNIWQACQQLATDPETCDALGIGCAWFESEGQCLPSTNCMYRDEATCKRIEQTTSPIPSCSWGAQTTYEVGTCSGEPTPGGRATCPMYYTKEECESVSIGIRGFPSSYCQWDDTNGCTIKETVCTDQTDAMLCYTLSPSSGGYGYCEWTPSNP